MGGWASLIKYFPVTNLKLKIAIIGAIRKEIAVAKSTSSLSLFSNKYTTINEPVTRENMDNS